MLVLSRQKGQTIMIGDEVEITIVDVRGDKVRVGVAAPRDVAVHRKEIYDAIHAENRAAAQVQPTEVGAVVPPPPAAVPNMKLVGQPSSDAFLGAALDEARAGLSEGGLPIGSVLVRGEQIIGRGRNRRVQHADPVAHAEIDALRNAGRQVSYKDCVLYTTLMPCYLCAGAIVQFGIPQVVVGDTVNFRGARDLLRGRRVRVTDASDAACIEMMSQFIRAHPELWNEDIGQ